MDSSIYIFGVFATPVLTFSLFWLLETIKSARQNKQANIRALRSIAFELFKIDSLLKKVEAYKSMWLGGHPMSFKTDVWERYGGEIVVSNKDRNLMEFVYVCLVLFNNTAKFLSDIQSKPQIQALSHEEQAGALKKIFDENILKSLKEIKDSLAEANDAVQKNIDTLEKETLSITVLKEFFGPSHRIIAMLQDFPKKNSEKKN